MAGSAPAPGKTGWYKHRTLLKCSRMVLPNVILLIKSIIISYYFYNSIALTKGRLSISRSLLYRCARPSHQTLVEMTNDSWLTINFALDFWFATICSPASPERPCFSVLQPLSYHVSEGLVVCVVWLSLPRSQKKISPRRGAQQAPLSPLLHWPARLLRPYNWLRRIPIIILALPHTPHIFSILSL